MKTKDEMEDWVRRCGMIPVAKTTVNGYDVYVAEGFLYPFPERDNWPEPKHFPAGAYVDAWWLGRDEVLLKGRLVFFDKNHDPELFITSRQSARINSAVADAVDHIGQLRKQMH